jgi:flavorubredoxin
MTKIDEIAPDVFRISTYVPEGNLQFNQFLVRDDVPLLYHTGMNALFTSVRDAVAKVIDPKTIGWIGFSHFEADECGALPEWQAIAPRSTAVCSFVGKMVSVDDVVANRPARALNDGEVLETGKHRFKFLQTPHVPHGWDAGHLFEETTGTFFCSDLFHQNNDVEPTITDGVVARFKETLLEYQKGPLADYLPYTPRTKSYLERLAALKPSRLAAMHGSTFIGDGERAILDLSRVMEEQLGSPGSA